MGLKKIFNKKNIGKIITGVAAFGCAFTATYLITNGRRVKSNLKPASDSAIQGETFFDKFTRSFLDRLTNFNEPLSFESEIKDFSVSSISTGEKYANVTGNVALAIYDDSKVEFTFDVTPVVQEEDLPLIFGYVDDNLYLSTGEEGIKVSYESTKGALDILTNTFKGLLNTSSLGGLDLSGLMESLNFDSMTPVEVDNGDNMNVKFVSDDIDVSFDIVKETMLPSALNINKLVIGDVNLACALSFAHIEKVVSFESEMYKGSKVNFNTYIPSAEWINRIIQTISTGSIGLNVGTKVSTGNAVLAKTIADFNVNTKEMFSEITSLTNLLTKTDISKIEVGGELVIETEGGKSLAKGSLTYVDNCTYLSIPTRQNEQIKQRIENEQVESIFGGISGIIGNFVKKSLVNTRAIPTRAAEVISDATTGNGLSSILSSFDISTIFKVIKSFRINEDELKLTLDLSSFGLGDNVTISIVTGEDKTEARNLIGLFIKDIKVAGVDVDIEITAHEFRSENIESIRKDKDSFKELDLTLINFLLGTLDRNQYKFRLQLKLSLFSESIKTTINIDFYLDISGDDFKVFAILPDHFFAPVFMKYGVNNVKLVYDSATGLVQIVADVNETNSIMSQETKKNHKFFYLADIDSFLDNIGDYIINDILYLNPNLLNAMELLTGGDLNISRKPKERASTNIFASLLSFVHEIDEETGTDTFSTDINIGSLIQIPLFNVINIVLHGEHDDLYTGRFTSGSISIVDNPLASLLGVSANIFFDYDYTWPEEEIESFTGYYDSLNEEQKQDFNENYFNNPEARWEIKK